MGYNFVSMLLFFVELFSNVTDPGLMALYPGHLPHKFLATCVDISIFRCSMLELPLMNIYC